PRRHARALLRPRRHARPARRLLGLQPQPERPSPVRSCRGAAGAARCRCGHGRGPGRATGHGRHRVQAASPGAARGPAPHRPRQPGRRGAPHRAARGTSGHAGATQPVERRGGGGPDRRVGGRRACDPLARPGAMDGSVHPGERGGAGMTVGELTQRLRRADFLDGLGIYVGAHEVALAHVVKRFFKVAVRHARTYPLPPAERAAERRQALAQAVLTFAREHRVDTRRAYLCLPRADTAFNRVLLPAAARENLAQVLEYEMEHLIPLPRDQVYFDFSVRELGEDRLEVLLMCIPREVVRVYLEALEDAFVRPRGIVLASTAIADYLAFCRGGPNGPIGLLVSAGETVELALLTGGRLVASQLVPAHRLAEPAEVSRSLARQLADVLIRRQMEEGLVAVEPQVREAKLLQDEIANLRKQIDILSAGQDQRVTLLLRELTDLVPADAYLTSLNLRQGRLTLEGSARSASDLIAALEKSKHFHNVSFTSPTTKAGDKERFSIVAEVAK